MKPVLLAVERPQHPGPRALQGQQALRVALDLVAVVVEDLGREPGSGVPADPGFMSCTPGSVVIMIPPVSVCHHVSTIGQRSPPITL